MQNLEAAVSEFEASVDLDFIDLGRLSMVINRLEGVRSKAANRAAVRGDQLLMGQSATSWVAQQCQMSKSSAADRLCVGAQLEKLSRIAAALSAGEIG